MKRGHSGARTRRRVPAGSRSGPRTHRPASAPAKAGAPAPPWKTAGGECGRSPRCGRRPSSPCWSPGGPGATRCPASGPAARGGPGRSALCMRGVAEATTRPVPGDRGRRSGPRHAGAYETGVGQTDLTRVTDRAHGDVRVEEGTGLTRDRRIDEVPAPLELVLHDVARQDRRPETRTVARGAHQPEGGSQAVQPHPVERAGVVRLDHGSGLRSCRVGSLREAGRGPRSRR